MIFSPISLGDWGKTLIVGDWGKTLIVGGGLATFLAVIIAWRAKEELSLRWNRERAESEKARWEDRIGIMDALMNECDRISSRYAEGGYIPQAMPAWNEFRVKVYPYAPDVARAMDALETEVLTNNALIADHVIYDWHSRKWLRAKTKNVPGGVERLEKLGKELIRDARSIYAQILPIMTAAAAAIAAERARASQEYDLAAKKSDNLARSRRWIPWHRPQQKRSGEERT